MARKKKQKARRAHKKTHKETSANIIEFCPKCGSITVPVKKGKSTYLKCRNCRFEKKREVKALKITEAIKKKRAVAILENDITPLPLTEKTCPKCSHERSHWWLQQTRSADEPPTQLFRCERCKYTWREYK